ncbi:MAG: LacI family DNA-binding transcriptional regulator [Clostridia bacterium]|nr:LacI family DNA-binding transcriptional regulator [Clostridia bacterium]
MITLKEIAAEAGVSVMTVSNVINNKTSKVSPQTAQRVREIVEKHHYEPNMAARSLISKASRIIVMLLPLWHETADSLLLDPYVGQMAGFIETLLREKGYYVMLCSFKEADQALALMRTWQADGAILMMPHEDVITRRLVKRSSAPLVVIDRKYDDLTMHAVCLNDRKGGYISTKHLLQMGHREIGFAGPTIDQSSVIHDRYMGYCDAMAEYGIEPNPAWTFDAYFHQEGGEIIGGQLTDMAHRPTAMVCTEDLIACGIMKAYQAKGLRTPEDISVVGFDDTLPSRLISPAITTVKQDVYGKASNAVNMLMDVIEHPENEEHYVMLDVELIERESVACR